MLGRGAKAQTCAGQPYWRWCSTTGSRWPRKKDYPDAHLAHPTFGTFRPGRNYRLRLLEGPRSKAAQRQYGLFSDAWHARSAPLAGRLERWSFTTLFG